MHTPTVAADADVPDAGGIRDLPREQLESYKVPRHVFLLTDADVSWLMSQMVDRRALGDAARKLIVQA